MSTRNRKRLIPILISCLLVVLSATVAVHAKGKQEATVDCTRFGESITQVPAGEQFTISGTGYKRSAQLALCIEGEGCTYPTADRDGEFSQGRTLYKPGVHKITVSEVGNRWSSYRERATGWITVTE